MVDEEKSVKHCLLRSDVCGGSTERVVVDGADPFTDIVEGGDAVKVVTSVPETEEGDVKVYVGGDGRTLVIEVKGRDGRYHKEIRLPVRVRTDRVEYVYRNGVLSIKLQKARKKWRLSFG